MTEAEIQITVSLPWPPSILSPNNRSHWHKKSVARKKYREDCGWIGKTVRPVFDDGEIPICIRFFPPDRRKRDMDNMLASLKSGLDGLSDAWGVDDSRFVLSLSIGPVVKGGSVQVGANAALMGNAE